MSTIEQFLSLSQYKCQLLNSSSVSLSTNVNYWTAPQSLSVQMSTIEQLLSLSLSTNVNYWTAPQSLLVQMSTIEQFLSLSLSQYKCQLLNSSSVSLFLSTNVNY